MPKLSTTAVRRSFDDYVRSGKATLGSILKKYPTTSRHEGMFRVARMIRQKRFRVSGVRFGLNPRETLYDSSCPLRDELVELAEKSPERKVEWISSPEYRD